MAAHEKSKLFGITPDTLTLGELFTLYLRVKGPNLTGQWKRGAERRVRLFFHALGGSTKVAAFSQSSVDTYVAMRRADFVTKQLTRDARKTFRRVPLVGEPRGLRNGALDADFRWLSSVFNWARRYKRPNGGARLLATNPLHDCTWPKETDVRRPVASDERFAKTLAVANDVDPLGRLTLALVIARQTGSRIDAILHLRVADVLRTPDEMRNALAAIGRDPSAADAWTYGALRWRAEFDKQGGEWVVPISRALRATLDAYLIGHAAEWLLPMRVSTNEGATAIEQPLTRALATKWLHKAEGLAGLPKQRGGGWQAYRRLWAAKRRHLPIQDVTKTGKWKSTRVVHELYQQFENELVLDVVNAEESSQ